MTAVAISPDIRMAIVGAPSYLSKYPAPKMPANLGEHHCINTRFSTRGGVYAWELKKAKRNVQVRVNGPWTFNSTYLVLEAALSGAGLAYVPEQLALPHFASGRLQPVLQDWCPTFPGLHIYYANRQVSPALSLVVEILRHRH
jgi:DNA-binding transcriptional LysR family regulator